MKAFRDAVAAAEAPHAGDLFLPVLQGLAQRRQRIERRVFELPDAVEEFADAHAAGGRVEPAGPQELPQFLLELIEGGERRMGMEIAREGLALFGIQAVGPAPQERKQPPVPAVAGIDLPPELVDVVADQPDDMEAVRHDEGPREVPAHDGPIGARQIHAHHPHPLLAFQPRQIAFQSRLGTAEHHVEHAVPAQVAQGGGIAGPAGEEVLVDAQHPRAGGVGAFRQLALQVTVVPALHGRRTHPHPPGQAALADAVMVVLANLAFERLRRPLVGQQAGKALAEVPAA